MRQRSVAGSILGVLVSLLCATSASAALTVNPPTAAPGTVVTVAGTSFSNAAGVSPVRIRLSTRNGQVLKSEAPDSAGRFSTTIVVPPLAAGTYLIIGTQTNDSTGQTDVTKANADGTQRSFTPSRTILRVRAASASPAGGSGPGGTGGPVALLALLLVPGLLAVAVRTARRRSTQNHPQLGH